MRTAPSDTHNETNELFEWIYSIIFLGIFASAVILAGWLNS